MENPHCHHASAQSSRLRPNGCEWVGYSTGSGPSQSSWLSAATAVACSGVSSSDATQPSATNSPTTATAELTAVRLVVLVFVRMNNLRARGTTKAGGTTAND